MILRLQSGEDIIGTTTPFDGGIHIVEPMSFYVNYRNNEPKGVLQLSHWLPVQMIMSNEAYIRNEDILVIMEPEEQFMEYYVNAVSKIKDVLEDQMDLDENQIKDIFDSMDNLKNQSIH
jgi:hypothetical protein